MARRVRLTKRASKKINNILTHLKNDFGDNIARKFLSRTDSFFEILVDFPQIGMLEDGKKGIYGFVIEKPITIFYRYDDNEVVVLNFFNNRSSPRKKS